jgi:hypothetical protein
MKNDFGVFLKNLGEFDEFDLIFDEMVILLCLGSN